MRLTDLSVKALPFEQGQRDYPDDAVRGLSVRVGIRTKTFMLLIRRGSHRSRVKLGTYPELTLSKARERAKDLLAEARVAKTETRVLRFEEALETYYRVQATQRRDITSRECERMLDKHFRPALGKQRLEDIRPVDIAVILDGLLDTPGT